MSRSIHPDFGVSAPHFTSTKSFYNLPCAHRQWRDDGHCAHVHGYSRSFHFTFACHALDPCGWVVDFGGLKEVKAFLEINFDHTLLINADDPLLSIFRELETRGAARLIIPPYGVSMEGTARWVCEYTNAIVRKMTTQRAWVVSVEARENDKNSALFYNPELPFDDGPF